MQSPDLDPTPASPAGAPRPGELKPSHGCAAFLVAGLAALSIASLLVAGAMFLGVENPLTSPSTLLASTLAAQLALLTAVPVAVALSGQPVAEVLALRRVGPRALLLAVVGLLAASLVGDWLIACLRELRPGQTSVLGDLTAVLRELPRPWLAVTIVALALVPAVCEESLLRGVVQTSFERRWGPAVAIVVAATLFALLHFDLFQSAAAWLMGLYLGLLRQVTGSLWAPLAAHAANNAVAATLMGRTGQFALETTSPWPALAGLAVALLCLDRLREGRR